MRAGSSRGVARKHFRAATLVVLARVAFQIGVEAFIATVECVAVVVFGEKRFRPAERFKVMSLTEERLRAEALS
jgi:hypothetical protein